MTEPSAPRPAEEVEFERIVYERSPPRATIRLNRPEVLNAFDFQTLRELAQTTPFWIEQFLSRWLGPMAGQRVADAGRQMLGMPDYAATRLADSVAACASDTPSGIAANRLVGIAANCAQAPASTRPATRVPSRGPLLSAADRSITPAASQPVTDPSGRSGRRVTSPRLSEKARTRTKA